VFVPIQKLDAHDSAQVFRIVNGVLAEHQRQNGESSFVGGKRVRRALVIDDSIVIPQLGRQGLGSTWF
jgi:hypothetical protein